MALSLVLIALSAWRITRLVVDDDIAFKPRAAIQTRFAGRWPADLVSCRHCVGVWASALAWGVYQVVPELSLVLAASALISLYEEIRWP